MRIMYDTNILISMMFFESENFLNMHKYITENHTLVLSSIVVEELKDVAEKISAKGRSGRSFFEGYSIHTCQNSKKDGWEFI